MSKISLINKAFLLKKTCLFSSLELDSLLVISEHLEENRYKKDSIIFKSHCLGSQLYIILEGCVLIFEDATTTEHKLKTFDFFGEEGLFNEKIREYRASALINTTLLSLNKPQLINIISEYPSVGISIIEAYAKFTNFRKR